MAKSNICRNLGDLLNSSYFLGSLGKNASWYLGYVKRYGNSICDAEVHSNLISIVYKCTVYIYFMFILINLLRIIFWTLCAQSDLPRKYYVTAT